MKTTGLNFLEAVAAMKEGKKVRRKNWWVGEHQYLCFGHSTLKDYDGHDYGIRAIQDLEATDWEIVEFISFDELMTVDGEWVKSDRRRNEDRIQMLNYKSSEYVYFIYQDSSGEHTLLRRKE